MLAGVARGLTNAEIGRELFIGEATVKTHLLRVFAKLGVDDRTRAVMVAVERGLLPAAGTAYESRASRICGQASDLGIRGAAALCEPVFFVHVFGRFG